MTSTYDITIIGAGPVGCAYALLMARYHPDPKKIALCQHHDRSNYQDPRVLAINHGSQRLLEQLNAWPHGQGAPIDTVHVSQRGRMGRTKIDKQDYAIPSLGVVLTYGSIIQALEEAVEHRGITCLRGDKARVIHQDDQGVTVAQGDHQWRSQIIVQAEGGTFDTQAKKDWSRDYQQHALLSAVTLAHPRPHWAWERFTPDGPIALLPHPDQNPHHYSLIWCVDTTLADQYLAMDDLTFSSHITHAFGDRLGKIMPFGPRHRFPLGANYKTSLVSGRQVAIGNAAQALHPVSGQGLNLGLRDAAQLAHALSLELTQDNSQLDWSRLLETFAHKRQVDRESSRVITDALPRLFKHHFSPLQHICGLGMIGLDMSFTARQSIANQFMYGFRT